MNLDERKDPVLRHQSIRATGEWILYGNWQVKLVSNNILELLATVFQPFRTFRNFLKTLFYYVCTMESLWQAQA